MPCVEKQLDHFVKLKFEDGCMSGGKHTDQSKGVCPAQHHMILYILYMLFEYFHYEQVIAKTGGGVIERQGQCSGEDHTQLLIA